MPFMGNDDQKTIDAISSGIQNVLQGIGNFLSPNQNTNTTVNGPHRHR